MVRKSKDGYGHKMPKVAVGYDQLKQYKEDELFHIHRFDEQQDEISNNNHMAATLNNKSQTAKKAQRNNLIHEIMEQSEEHKMNAASSSDQSEKDKNNESLKNQGLIDLEKMQAELTWNQHRLKLQEYLERKSLKQNNKGDGQHTSDAQQASTKLRYNSNFNNQQENENARQLVINPRNSSSGMMRWQNGLSKLESNSNMIPSIRRNQIRSSLPNDIFKVRRSLSTFQAPNLAVTSIGQKLLADLGVKKQDFVNIMHNNEGLKVDTVGTIADRAEKKREAKGLSKFIVLDHNIERQEIVHLKIVGGGSFNIGEPGLYPGLGWINNTSQKNQFKTIHRLTESMKITSHNDYGVKEEGKDSNQRLRFTESNMPSAFSNIKPSRQQMNKF